MFGLGMSELLVLGILALILIGPDQLPEIARTIGKFLNELKRSTEGLTDDLKKQAKVDLNFIDPGDNKILSPSLVKTAENNEHRVTLDGKHTEKENQLNLFDATPLEDKSTEKNTFVERSINEKPTKS